MDKRTTSRGCKNSYSFRRVISKLNLRAAGGNYSQVKQYIKEYKLDISHFKGRGWNKGLKGLGIIRIPLKDILKKEPHSKVTN